MIDCDDTLAMARQANLVGISGSRTYYVPRVVGQADLALIRRISQLHRSSHVPVSVCSDVRGPSSDATRGHAEEAHGH